MAIISWKSGFVFVKTIKTAGTSIEIDLSRYAGDDAVVTQIMPQEPGHIPRNHLDDQGEPRFYNHMPASEIRDLIGAQRFGSLYRFCVERDPVEKAVSSYRMLRYSPFHNPDGAFNLSWDEFVERGGFPRDIQRYSVMQGDQRVLLVDHILRYDDLERQLAQVMAFWGSKGFG